MIGGHAAQLVIFLMPNPIHRKKKGFCDFDGSELYQRDDDKAETVIHRIQVYLDQTSPLIAYYRDLGKLIEIDGMQAIEDVNAALMDALKK